ncbi:GNAT family N-acetyltransferase [Terrabacter sp. 2RAF25]|uniref:GNAT family N-acetyltransferase n=1 Tax=Terrabacter sp. 2RAF25 TaxID=3232998 RepID=UPI003F9A64AD
MTERTGDGIDDPTDESTAAIRVVDNPGRGRFELFDGDRVIGIASYAVVRGDGGEGGEGGEGGAEPDRVVFFHTEVDPAYEGQGLAGRLADFALSSTVASGRRIVALCPYIKVYLRRHPEPYAAHVVTPTEADVEAADEAARAAAG